jgi:hypothetical protein
MLIYAEIGENLLQVSVIDQLYQHIDRGRWNDLH